MDLNKYQEIFDKMFSEKIEEKRLRNEELSSEELEKAMTTVIASLMEDMPEVLFETLMEDMPRTLEEHDSDRIEFESRLSSRWKEAFNYYEALIVAVEEIAAALISEENTDYKDLKKLEVLLKIHSKSVVISKEILCLLKSGFVDGAMARWRSLHETNVIFHTISSVYADEQLYSNITNRYLDYSKVESYLKYKVEQGLAGRQNTNLKISKEYHDIIRKYGKDFSSPNGWAKPLIKKDKITFRDLERFSKFEHLSPYYKEANFHVHTSPTGLYNSLSFMPFYETGDFYLYGPSNYGLSIPGQLSSLTLLQITTTLLILNSNIDKLLIAKTLKSFVDKSMDAFSSIQNQIEVEEIERIKGTRKSNFE